MRRLEGTGALLDRSRPLRFHWADREIDGYVGDTIASALLAAGVDVVGRGVTSGRPRGIVAASTEEPNAYVQLGTGGTTEPLVRATTAEAFDGLVSEARSTKGYLSLEPDTDRFEKRFLFCDVLVIGGGAAGRAAAADAAAAGREVVLVDDAPPRPGVASLDGVRVLARTTAFATYERGFALLSERVSEHLPHAARGRLPLRRLWQVRAPEVVLATGAQERPIVFARNDLPGVMLAGALGTYLRDYAVAPERVVLFTTNDSAYDVARQLVAGGVEVAAVVDPRAAHPDAGSIRVVRGVVEAALGEDRVEGAVVGGERIACDAIGVSGGFDPRLNLHVGVSGPVRWDEAHACFVPAGTVRGFSIVGAAAGEVPATEPVWWSRLHGSDGLPGPDETMDDASFVDLHRDVSVSGLRRALEAGVRHIEHVKRYTLVGTGADQGRTATVNAAALTAILTGRPVAEIGLQQGRPPYQPQTFGSLAGRARGPLFEPIRTTPIHEWHVAAGARFEDVGQWKRPWYFPRAGEDMDAAVLRECDAVRTGVGVMDASTLGKIDVQGRDAGEFLDRLYVGRMSTLKPGRARYGVMCAADGMVFDDGVALCLADGHFVTTTTTGNAAAVLDWMEEWLQTEWPDLDVWLTSVTEQWATVAVVGPRSREVLAELAPAEDVSREAFRFMAVREDVEVAGMRARVARISFSGELAYEINVPGYLGLDMWKAVMAAGEPYGITPYGTEAMHVLRAEKGYFIVGQDTDGTVDPYDLGAAWMVGDAPFVGRRSFARAESRRTDRKRLVGLLPHDPAERLPEGAQLVADPESPAMLGHVTSSYRSSPRSLDRTFALALVRGGTERIGETLYAPLVDRMVAVTVTGPVLYDPKGERRDG